MIKYVMFVFFLAMGGCIGMGTHPNQISGSYVSTAMYEDLIKKDGLG